MPFRIAVSVTVSAPCTHHWYINDGNYFTFLCNRSPVGPKLLVSLGPTSAEWACRIAWLAWAGRRFSRASEWAELQAWQLRNLWKNRTRFDLNGSTATANLRKRRTLFFYVSYGILTDERDCYVLLPRCTEIRLRTNGNVTLETKNDNRPSDWRAACVCDCAKWRVGPIGVRVRHDVEADDDTELSMKFSHVRSMTTPSSLLSRK